MVKVFIKLLYPWSVSKLPLYWKSDLNSTNDFNFNGKRDVTNPTHKVKVEPTSCYLLYCTNIKTTHRLCNINELVSPFLCISICVETRVGDDVCFLSIGLRLFMEIAQYVKEDESINMHMQQIICIRRYQYTLRCIKKLRRYWGRLLLWECIYKEKLLDDEKSFCMKKSI